MNKVTVLSGAGISQESGIKTFRDSNGLWENHAIEDVTSPIGFQNNPSLVQEFYNLRRAQLFEVEPNSAHIALAQFEKRSDIDLCIITQNVDDLHLRAGSKNVIHMHGELRKIRNLKTNEIKSFEDDIQECDYEIWRPDIVWFGEEIKEIERIQDRLLETEVFLSIGTSSQVFPAAQFFQYVKDNGGECIELNLEQTQMSKLYDQSILGKASDIVPQFLEDFFNE